ncbi:type I pullulanase [Corynebacterium diphtheriae bv. mitis]|uniref:type I pullulanase n=1 Tax=Corynebacterium diphtheriae TaxID=1717 RepID=UPI00092C817C|nr:type I pullulanase [Corynebacterium diphtheriae]OWN35678.1 hydrolase [Corynebacterium belfantii]MBG9357876.1 type I pullulanase [Corynebacterium diphtheriae bv. mitis]MBG9360254.1 type I pullulanase [Corynebacterium diphtheriae bv. mitis]MBG9362417.1 type I pullulanase [Corynebacterium diphtheriae bv. mitis]MBG9364586.1 type I pullulanase [Corynebacterium diphtheriae bv. mitis]
MTTTNSYTGQLGAFLTPHGDTCFRVWSPDAATADLLIENHTVSMHPIGDGVWEAKLDGDRHGQRYSYRLSLRGETIESVDPYARAVTANGTHGVVVTQSTPVPRMPAFTAPTDAIIYEAHVRDLSIAPNSGIHNKGRFLGLTERGTHTTAGNPSGLDYILSLGVTHIQLLPIFDFGSVDETGDLSYNAQYNWGYDPMNYNAPEGSYSSNPNDPFTRIDELKHTIRTLHDAGLRVIMDVVYNHVYDTTTSPLERTAPGHYFRMTDDGTFHDGTFCGNETASENPMMRKFIIDSVTHWATEYGLDGFRFDLMGIHDVDTMNAIRTALDAIDPSIIILGEGWNLGNHPPHILPANQHNAAHMPRIAHFNDSLRDTLKGSTFHSNSRGLLTGDHNPEHMWTLFNNIKGAQHLPGLNFTSANHTVNYTEAHDNHTLYDRLHLLLPDAPHDELIRRCQLATTIQYLACGITFIHAGQEFARTKNNIENSYNSPDHINAIDYDRAAQHPHSVQLLRDLNNFRKTHTELFPTEYDDINELYEATLVSGDFLTYSVGKQTTVAINFSTQPRSIPTEGCFAVLLDDHMFPTDKQIETNSWTVAPLSVSILQQVS